MTFPQNPCKQGKSHHYHYGQYLSWNVNFNNFNNYKYRLFGGGGCYFKLALSNFKLIFFFEGHACNLTDG